MEREVPLVKLVLFVVSFFLFFSGSLIMFCTNIIYSLLLPIAHVMSTHPHIIMKCHSVGNNTEEYNIATDQQITVCPDSLEHLLREGTIRSPRQLPRPLLQAAVKRIKIDRLQTLQIQRRWNLHSTTQSALATSTNYQKISVPPPTAFKNTANTAPFASSPASASIFRAVIK